MLDGYVVLNGDEETALFNNVALLQDPDQELAENTWDVADIPWQGTDGVWHNNFWERPSCLIPLQPVRARLAVIDVAPTPEGAGYSRAVWLRCLADEPAQ